MTPQTIDGAEQALRRAIDSGDRDMIAACEAIVDRLDPNLKPSAPTAPLLGSALWYAERGLPVFMLSPGTKIPRAQCQACKDAKCPERERCGHETCHGLHDATTDLAKIREWWTANPKANIGIATGHRFDVVDIDGPEGQQSRAEHWDGIFAQVDADSVAKVLTPRPGGMHIWVPATGDANSTKIVPSVDYRGVGGYAVAPPSVVSQWAADNLPNHHVGPYRFLGTPRLDASSPRSVA